MEYTEPYCYWTFHFQLVWIRDVISENRTLCYNKSDPWPPFNKTFASSKYKQISNTKQTSFILILKVTHRPISNLLIWKSFNNNKIDCATDNRFPCISTCDTYGVQQSDKKHSPYRTKNLFWLSTAVNSHSMTMIKIQLI